jgi:hypothetical protein
LEHDLFRKPLPTFRDHALGIRGGGPVAESGLAQKAGRPKVARIAMLHCTNLPAGVRPNKAWNYQTDSGFRALASDLRWFNHAPSKPYKALIGLGNFSETR